MSSTHGLKTSERRLGSVGATARERGQKDRVSRTDRNDEKKSLLLKDLFHKHCESRLYSLNPETEELIFLSKIAFFSFYIFHL